MKTAMILAAGRGERLKPLTNQIPKGMCLVGGVPLIEHHIINLVKADFSRVIINHSYFGAQIRNYFGNGRDWGIEILYSPEPVGGLETGGGIFNALPLLGNEPFITINADIYTDYKFKMLKLPESSLAHLVLGPNPTHNPHGDFGLTNSQHLSNLAPYFTFLGIAIYHPKIFDISRPGRYSVTPLIRSFIKQEQVSGELFKGCWIDIGTIERLNFANELAICTSLNSTSRTGGCFN